MLSLLGVLFDGLAYGALLFVISVGLSITLGLMGFNNLAHGAFAMAGGYLLVTLMSKAGIGFLPALPIVFCIVAVGSLVLERTLYRQLYKSTPLDQVLLSVGIIFVATAGTTFLWGPGQQPVVIPEWLSGQYSVLGLDLSRYRLFLMAIVAGITLALVFGLERTRFGARIRASVDNQRTAESMGIRVERVFQMTFALGSGLAGLGGALGVDVLGLDPNFAIKYLVYFLLVVVVGGPGSVFGTLLAALLLGVADIAGKYYVPQLGAFIIYAAMIFLLLLFPHGLLGRRKSK
ncbi:branched-chain amino acid ABC transporter permease [Geobacter argillaceus]|uniref:Amino acid/amide ABC transporter membrane protein 1, HAAT family (TC 3.A.1.4.-) n=1 Tax=Geobacter argillaceus TaxID=345631 RepID=A0A562VIT8_9BACT|nr:branched-chain amino acid ABC transporter permease [Geobacter argillaceus]TWJ17790.1 amino acid/amide ABC transporter membrane protein 1, HAAT family (TC 3.A.1.4.-) [Geobacter argillaceus]